MFSIHFFESVQEVVWVGEGHEAVSSGLACSAISNHPRHLEGGISTEDGAQDIIVDLIAEISAEDPVIVFRPVLHSLILPHFPSDLPHDSHLLLLLLFDLLALGRFSLHFFFRLLLDHLFLFLGFLLFSGFGLVGDGLFDLEGIYLFDLEHVVESFI